MKYRIRILKDTPIDNMGDILDFPTWTKKYNYLYPYTYVLFKDKEIKAFFNDSLWAKTFKFEKWFELVKVTKQQKPYDNTTKKQLEEAITAAMQGITSCNGYVWNLEKPSRSRIASISPGDLVFVNDSHSGIYVEKCEHYHDSNGLFVKINDVNYNYDSITGIIHLHPIKDDEH